MNDKWDKNFYNMLDNVQKIKSRWVMKWCGYDDMRLELLATAMATDKIRYRMQHVLTDMTDNTLFDDNNVSKATGLVRVDKMKDRLRCTDHEYNIEFDAPSLKKWLNKAYFLKSEPVPEMPFMSDKLAFAVECSKALYPNGYKDTGESLKDQRDMESGRIRNYLANHDLSVRARDALIVQLNPVSK